MSKEHFDPYEYIAVIAPGAVVAVGVFTEWPNLRDLVMVNDFTIGGFGLFVIGAFILGHIVQAIGNVIEWALWKPLGGMPSFWVTKNDQKLISPSQRDRLIKLIQKAHGDDVDVGNLDGKAWASMTREIYSSVSRAGRTKRIDTFNRTYGLMRGIAAGFLILAAVLCAAGPDNRKAAIVVACLAVPALFRAFRFGRNYARELFVEYIALEQPTAS